VRVWATLALAAGSALLGGCFSPRAEAAHRAAELRFEALEASILARDPVERRVTWTKAVDLLRTEGPAVLRVEDAVFRAELALSRPYRQLIPLLDLRAGVVEPLNSLGEITEEDVLYDVFISGILSGLVNLPENVFTTRLAYLRARLAAEQSWREQVVLLHALFLRHAALAEQRRVLELTLAATDRAVESGVRGAVTRQRDTEDRLDSVDRAFEDLSARTGALLGEPTVRWVLDPEGLPRVDAGSVLGPSLEADLLGSIPLRIAATDLVAADARVTQAWVDYLPQPELFITSPALFARSAGVETVADFEDLRLTARLRLTIDLRGSIGERVRLSKLDRETALRETRLAVRTAAVEAVRLVDDLERIERDRAEAARRLELAQLAVAAEGVEGFERRLTSASRARAAIARAELNAVALAGPLLTLDRVWERTFPYAEARTPGREPAPHDADPIETNEQETPAVGTEAGGGDAVDRGDGRGDARGLRADGRGRFR